MKPKTDKQIDTMVAKLKKLKPRVRHFTIFGDDNWAKFDRVVDCLSNRSDMDDIANADMDDYSLLTNAVDWMEGNPDADAPDRGWPLQKNAKDPSPEMLEAMARARRR